jgi:hypothetical protein
MRLKMLATVLALSTTMAYAQDDAAMMEEMSAGISMLESSAAAALKKYGLEADVMSLTLSQLAEINGAMADSNNEADKKAAIEAALRK